VLCFWGWCGLPTLARCSKAWSDRLPLLLRSTLHILAPPKQDALDEAKKTIDRALERVVTASVG